MNTKSIRLRPLISVLIIVVLIGLDQLTKYLAYVKLSGEIDEISVINKIFGLYYVENTGISFSMLNSKMALIIIITSVILIALVYVLIRTPRLMYYMPFTACLSVILAGAIGNLFDRIYRGYVIDFIMLDFVNFPIFNVADICVCVGIFVLVLLIFFKYKDKDFEYIFRFKKTDEKKD